MNPSISVPLTQENVGRMAGRLRDYLSAAGGQLKQAHAYEALARVFGYKNWNTLKALLPSEGATTKKQQADAAMAVSTVSSEPAATTSMTREQFDELMEQEAFELVVQRVIADKRWGGWVVTVHHRGTGLNIEHDGEVLFRHRNALQFDIYIRDKDLEERPLTDRVILKAAIRHLNSYAGHLNQKVEQKDYFKSRRAPGAIPAAQFTNPRPWPPVKPSGETQGSSR